MAEKKRQGLFELSYTARTALSFALVAVMTALVAIGATAFVWQQYFQSYRLESIRTLAENTAARIAEGYYTTNSLFNTNTAMTAYIAVRTNEGVALRVENAEGETVYDSTIGSGINSSTGYPSLEPNDRSLVGVADIVVGDTVVGSVHAWVYGENALMRETDTIFRDNFYQAIFFSGLAAAVLASCIGVLFARNLVAPIKRITQTARALKEGNLSARTHFHGDDEISHLGETFDEMAESMEKDRELERRLTTDVAHELRTPLMAIRANVEAMVDGIYEPTQERLIMVDAEVQRLSRLVDALLKLSRLENRSTPLDTKKLDVGELVESIVASHEIYVSESGLTLEFKAEPGIYVFGDADMIRQATANLISNAVRYTPEGGSIFVSVTKDDETAAIAVKDTGIGLSPDEAKMVFSRFWRADSGRNRESGGLGVGLSVVKEIVDRHNGWVSVEGEKDKGACFTIHLPLYQEDSKTNPRLGSGESRKLSKRSKEAPSS